MKNESNNTFTIAVSGTFTMAREDMKSLLLDIMPKPHDGGPRNAQPKIEVTQLKPEARDFGPSQRLAFSMRETADILGVSYSTVHRLIQRGLLRSSLALRHKIISRAEIERFLKETSRATY
jgi:excisionase family DNA binding protein